MSSGGGGFLEKLSPGPEWATLHGWEGRAPQRPAAGRRVRGGSEEIGAAARTGAE